MATNGMARLVVTVFSIFPAVANWLLSKVTGTDTFTIAELLNNEYDIVGIEFLYVLCALSIFIKIL